MVPIEQGAKIAVEKCMHVKPEDKVLIVADEDSKDIGIALRKASLDITKHVRFFNVDLPAYGGRPLKEMPKGLREAIGVSTVTFFVAGARQGELATLREPLRSRQPDTRRHDLRWQAPNRRSTEGSGRHDHYFERGDINSSW